MSALTDRLDHFVRWFFNSSPTTMAIESIELARPRKEEHADRRRAGKAQAHGKRHQVRRPRSQPQQRARA